MKKSITLFLVVVMALALVTGCAAPAANPAAGGAAADKLELVLVPPAMESPFYKAILDGAQPKAEALGYKFTLLSPQKPDDPAEQVKIVEDLVTRGVAGIAICAHDDKAIVSAVKKANDAKIPIVIFNSLTDLPDGEVYAYVGYEQEAGGANIADWVNKVTNGNANIAILEGLPGFHSTARAGGFNDQIAAKYPGLKVVASQPADWSREKGMNVATNMFQADGSIQVFYGLNDEMALGAAQAMKQLNQSGILTVGIDGNPNAMEAVKKDELTATLYVNPVGIGAASMEMLDAAIKGKPSPENKRVVVDTIVVDKTMVDDYLD